MKTKLKSFREQVKSWQVPKILLNKYFFSFFIFTVWMIFFDQNNLFLQMQRMNELRNASSQTKFYIRETAETQKQLDELKSDEKTLEKFAREKYFMKKPDEDVFVIVEK